LSGKPGGSTSPGPISQPSLLPWELGKWGLGSGRRQACSLGSGGIPFSYSINSSQDFPLGVQGNLSSAFSSRVAVGVCPPGQEALEREEVERAVSHTTVLGKERR
jgi:hypothetical protein